MTIIIIRKIFWFFYWQRGDENISLCCI